MKKMNQFMKNNNDVINNHDYINTQIFNNVTHKLSLINDGGWSIWELGAEHGCGIL